jgi:hypothetical protein
MTHEPTQHVMTSPLARQAPPRKIQTGGWERVPCPHSAEACDGAPAGSSRRKGGPVMASHRRTTRRKHVRRQQQRLQGKRTSVVTAVCPPVAQADGQHCGRYRRAPHMRGNRLLIDGMVLTGSMTTQLPDQKNEKRLSLPAHSLLLHRVRVTMPARAQLLRPGRGVSASATHTKQRAAHRQACNPNTT